MEQINLKDNVNNIIYTNNNKNINNKKTVEMLQAMFKNILDKKLINLEKNSDKHFSMLGLTLTATKYITKLTSEINNGLKKNNHSNVPKLNKMHKFSKSVRKMNTIGTNLASERTNYKVLQRIKSEAKNNYFDKNKITKKNLNINKNELIFKSPMSLKKFLDNTNTKIKLNTINNSSLNKYINSSKKTNRQNNKKGKFFHTRNHNSIDSNITSEKSSYRNNNIKNSKYKGNSLEQLSFKKNSNGNKKIGLIGKLKRSIDKFEVDKNSPNKKGSLNKDKNISKKSSNNNIKSIRRKKDCKKIDKEIIIKNLENNWKKEETLINKDPLLINAMKDLEFIPKELISINISRDELSMFINKSKDTPRNSIKDNIKEKINTEFSVINTIKNENSIFVDYLPNIITFLSLSDILKFKNSSKKFRSYILNYYLKIFDVDKVKLLEKKNKLNLKEDEMNQKLDIENLNLTKGTLKAIKLLDEDIFSRLFLENKTPKKDILLVYKIYFQLINYKEIINNNVDISDNIFWEKCRNYFMEYKGKISDLLIDNIKEKKLILTDINLYKIYKLFEQNDSKLSSAYFSKLCGTTSLFIFYIRDILDFLGFSNEIKYQKNSYYSFCENIKYLDNNIKKLNSFCSKISIN